MVGHAFVHSEVDKFQVCMKNMNLSVNDIIVNICCLMLASNCLTVCQLSTISAYCDVRNN